jgi:hypothetical protein
VECRFKKKKKKDMKLGGLFGKRKRSKLGGLFGEGGQKKVMRYKYDQYTLYKSMKTS